VVTPSGGKGKVGWWRREKKQGVERKSVGKSEKGEQERQKRKK
jgi:hypothetical protein